ncbi:MAG: ABC transporter permease subunit [Pseudonocardiaceae bacterium]
MSTSPGGAVRAPLGRLLRSELRWVLRRPRTQIALVLLALVPVLIGIGIAAAGPPGDSGLISQVAGNGLVLPVVALSICLTLLLPLAVAMAAADALAGESAHGTLRGLLLAPVSRTRLVLVKAIGVLTVAVAAVAAVVVVGIVTGLILVGPSGSFGLLTLSGTEVSPGSALLRVSLAAVWTVGQLAAVGAVALAVSSATEHPLVVLAAVLGGLIVFGILSAIPALDWLQPALLTTGWFAIADVLRDPLPLDGLASSSLRAGCYLLIGVALTLVRTATREA